MCIASVWLEAQIVHRCMDDGNDGIRKRELAMGRKVKPRDHRFWYFVHVTNRASWVRFFDP